MSPRPTGRTSSFHGRPSVVLRSGELQATFLPTLGMLGASLRHRGAEHLSLPGGLERWESGHTLGLPLLHPWANRLARGPFRVGRTRIDLDARPHLSRDGNGLPIHGVMTGARAWEIVELDADDQTARVTARFAFDQPDLLASFPFPHVLTVVATVDGSELSVATTLRPTSRRAVPVSFGWHPYLRLPGVRRREVTVHLPTRHHVVLDELGLPTGERRRERSDRVVLDGRTFDDGYALGRDRTFTLTGGDRQISVRFHEGYPFAQVYAPRGRPFVAVEPMSAPTNALVTGDHPTVAPGSSFTARFAIRVGTIGGS